MIICPICETENEQGAEECILCGAPLDNAEPAESFLPEEDLSSPPFSSSSLSEIPASSTAIPSESNPFSGGEAQTPFSEEMKKDLFSSESLPSSSDVARALFAEPPSPPPPSVPPVSSPSSSELSSPFKKVSPQPSPPVSPAAPEATLPPVDIPAPGTLCLIVYFNRKPALYFPVIYDQILIGRQDPASNAYPELDLTPFDPGLVVSRKHAYFYKEGDDYYVYPISNSGTQVNQKMVEIGEKKRVKENDVIILSGRIAIRFART